LLNKIKHQADALEEIHKNHLKCRNGCDLCCIDFSILPVEFYFILNELKNRNFKVESDLNTENETCVFLKNGSCTIYEQRPVMCRTHGLPLLYANDDGEWELSACELNFTEFDFDEFTEENTFSQDKYNSKLFLLNREFIADFQDKKYSEFDLIPVAKLADYLTKNKKHHL
jgi:Fe-S-cluster containining protein